MLIITFETFIYIYIYIYIYINTLRQDVNEWELGFSFQRISHLSFILSIKSISQFSSLPAKNCNISITWIEEFQRQLAYHPAIFRQPTRT